MDLKLSAKLVSLFLVLSVCLLGYVSMTTLAHPFPVPGAISIDPDTTIYQSSTPGSIVQIYFSDSVETLDKLVIDWQYVQINDGTKIGVQSSVNCELNLTTWEPASINVGGTVAEFSISSAGNWVPFDIYLGNLNPGKTYRVMIDDSLGPLLDADSTGTAAFTFSGNPGAHDFEVILPPPPTSTQQFQKLVSYGIALVLILIMINFAIGTYNEGFDFEDFVQTIVVLVIGLSCYIIVNQFFG